jgi:hypothetical protein
MYENAVKPQRGDMLVEKIYENAVKPQKGDMLISKSIFFSKL